MPEDTEHGGARKGAGRKPTTIKALTLGERCLRNLEFLAEKQGKSKRKILEQFVRAHFDSEALSKQIDEALEEEKLKRRARQERQDAPKPVKRSRPRKR